MSLHGALGTFGIIIGLLGFTNNLFIIAKCTYATPDPVQPDQHYLRVHCVYLLCLVSHVQSHSSKRLPSSCDCSSLFSPLPLLCHLLRPSHVWARPVNESDSTVVLSM